MEQKSAWKAFSQEYVFAVLPSQIGQSQESMSVILIYVILNFLTA